MRGGDGTSGKSGSSPNLCNSGLLRTDQSKQSLSKASIDVVVEAAVVVTVVEMVVVPRTVVVGKAVVATAVINGDEGMMMLLSLLLHNFTSLVLLITQN